MLHTYSVGKAYLGSGWAIHPLSGSLLKTSVNSIDRFRSSQLPSIVSTSLNHCDKPYSLSPSLGSSAKSRSPNLVESDASFQIQTQFQKIKLYRSLNFYASILYASITRTCFEDSKEAFAALNALNGDVTHNNCLEKCLTVAKCSASFREKGVLLIGAHLPLQAMHAWIIEDGCQPDDDDRQWINFMPLMAITHSNYVA